MYFWQSFLDRLKGIPWGIIVNVYAIIGLGLYNLYSATSSDVTSYRFHDQLNWVILGTFALIVWGVILDARKIERYTFLGYAIVCLMLLAVDAFGQTTKGSQRWLVLGPVRLQPSEIAKFIIILIVARSFTILKGISEFSILGLWRQCIFIGIPAALILAQPDLGTASLILMISAMQIAFVRVKIDWKTIVALAVFGALVCLFGWNFVLYDYQKQRALGFLNPMMDQQGSSYQLLQSMIAVGSGGLWGKGFLQGTQAQLSFLPERHTDFIFSVWAEEHGFVGCVILLVLYALLIIQMLRAIERARDTFSAMIAVGVTAFFVAHMVINMTMVVGLFPVVGVPLSLVSYGGSHMLTAMSCIGLLVAVERKRALSVSS